MKPVPHDYYLKFMDINVFDDLLKFHHKTNFTIHTAVEPVTYLHRFPETTLQQLTGNELRLYQDMDLTVQMPVIENLNICNPLSRIESCSFFHKRELTFNTIKKLISPLLARNTATYKRGYPSGGALYPIEVFLCNLSENTTDWPCDENVLHLLPQSKKFEIIQCPVDREKLIQAIIPSPNEIGSPNIAIVYATYIPKTIFKYRHRGYRLAHLEAGSMYMLIDLMSKQLEIPNRVWSGYCDNMICKCIGLNPTLLLPLCVQLVGGEQ